MAKLKYRKASDLEDAIDAYFAKIERQQSQDGGEKVPTIGGLCLFLKIDRDTLLNYEKRKGFDKIVTAAKDRIFFYKQVALVNKANVAGLIFDMKNNYGWTDRITETVATTEISIEDFLKENEFKL